MSRTRATSPRNGRYGIPAGPSFERWLVARVGDFPAGGVVVVHNATGRWEFAATAKAARWLLTASAPTKAWMRPPIEDRAEAWRDFVLESRRQRADEVRARRARSNGTVAFRAAAPRDEDFSVWPAETMDGFRLADRVTLGLGAAAWWLTAAEFRLARAQTGAAQEEPTTEAAKRWKESATKRLPKLQAAVERQRSRYEAVANRVKSILERDPGVLWGVARVELFKPV